MNSTSVSLGRLGPVGFRLIRHLIESHHTQILCRMRTNVVPLRKCKVLLNAILKLNQANCNLIVQCDVYNVQPCPGPHWMKVQVQSIKYTKV